ncbi:hypothetical protein A2886_03550 [candidate division WWE3 bacterium RIFCSPHIGHO2_01_FULL_42_13]|uniref:FAD-binding FR-type domain-containing protein n=1 Tax=candidate division WWE3 bacterium RIFCSPHIGHO2_01_FULL_42_13 TaxID=1802617 RepID=A0A1F4UR63_UNCKA|nr:MAG: hypothetical protein A2886_03550 [candidate division WWE3 bacterium RIFCSPHIGHO2_01_FULL_42_13]
MLLSKTKLWILLGLYLLFILTAAVVTVLSSPGVFKFDALYKFGQIFGVVSLSLLVVQQVLSARIPLIEKNIGHDRLMRFHHLNANFILLFVLAHPLSLFFRPLFSGRIKIFGLVKSFGLGQWLGALAILLIILIIITAVFSKRLGLRYDQWRKVHLVAYVVLILGFVHSYMIGSDILTRQHLYYWWWFLAAVSVSALFYLHIVRPHRFKKSIYEVAKVEPNTHDVTNVYLKPLNGKKLDFKPGQFAFITIYSKAVLREEHPFTISASPTEDHLMFSIKSSGDFTANVHTLKEGDRVKVEGPYGVFSIGDHRGHFVFIAGGIGITPFRSMLRFVADQHVKVGGVAQEITLIYANKTKEDIAFREEIAAIKKSSKWLKVVHVVGGFVTKELVSAEVSNIKRTKFFVCGPPPMMAAVVGILNKLGVSSNYIYTEKFSLK